LTTAAATVVMIAAWAMHVVVFKTTRVTMPVGVPISPMQAAPMRTVVAHVGTTVGATGAAESGIVARLFFRFDRSRSAKASDFEHFCIRPNVDLVMVRDIN
jgi:hypothetical protein